VAAADEPTREELDQWRSLEKQRLDAGKLARAAKSAQEPLETKFFNFVKAKGGKKRRTTRYGYGLRIEDKKLNVSWKDEWLKDHTAQEAVSLASSQPTKEILEVDPPADVAVAVAKAA
jgi:hypothetical protein